MRRCLPAWLYAATLFGQSGLTPEVELLARIKDRMRDNLARLPNYTCLQTIERSVRRPPSRRFILSDALRLEVALVDGKEMYAWPGAQNFEDRDVLEMVGGGAFGTGDFGLHARAVFLGQAPRFTYVGEETLNGRRSYRYDYSVPQLHSGFTIRSLPNRAIVGYHGSFWAAAGTLDLLRLVVHADDIPPVLEVAAATDTLDYARVRIGESDFLLPSASELVMVATSGTESRNRTSFSACRQYTGESTLTFAEPPPEAPAGPVATPAAEIRLPADVSFQLALEAPIDSSKAAVGDPIRATLLSPIRHNKKVLVPKGAVFSGRLVRLERRTIPLPGITVAMRFDLAEFAGGRALFRAHLDDVMGMLGPPRAGMGNRRFLEVQPADQPGTGTFFVRSASVVLPRGLRTIWHTIEFQDLEKP